MTRIVRMPEETRPRIETLASLPVFFNLTDRPVAVIGGSAAAAWKAELLAASGAMVSVFAETMDAEMAAVVSTSPHVDHVGGSWQKVDLSAFALIVADAADKAEATAIQAAVRAAGVPCNVIDRPAFCDFSFGTIVNRVPVTIGISTDGAAPVLGQAIRRRIEAVLPRGLGRWAAAAKAFRDRVAEALSDRRARGRFWTRFAEEALGANRNADPERRTDELLRESSSAGDREGRITIVGAGPGADDTLTLGAVRALQTADVILHDSLVSGEVLELARREARRIDVGKRSGRPSCKQEDINRLAIDLARGGDHVVRLKAGDPGVFGRAGEEVDAFQAEGIHVQIIPGITAALAMAARLGVSLTDRRHAQSVRFVTAHSAAGALPETIDWQGIAHGNETTVFYMGGRVAGDLAAQLIGHGLSPETPAAIAAAIGRPEERIVRTSVQRLGDEMPAFDATLPMLIAVGEVLGERHAEERVSASAGAGAP